MRATCWVARCAGKTDNTTTTCRCSAACMHLEGCKCSPAMVPQAGPDVQVVAGLLTMLS